jgi:HAD superfamily hydrolase (TIGR01509 family)
MEAVTTVIFDLDGTLIDLSVYDQLRIPLIDELMRRFGRGKVEAAIRKVGEEGVVDTFFLCEELGCLDFYHTMLKDYAKKAALKSYDLEAIAAAKKKCRVGIASNSHCKTIELFLQQFGIEVDFVFSNDEGGEKNRMEFWQKLIKKEHLEPVKTLLVDDSEEYRGIAERLGIRTVSGYDLKEAVRSF